MIFYFSGTGNSKWIAQETAKATGDEAVDLTTVEGYEAGPEETVGLVFPVYAWGAPEIVLKFAAGISGAAYRFAICTCSREAGKTMEQLEKVFPLDAMWSVIMPSNYIPEEIDPPEVIREKVEAARDKLPQICEAIMARSKVEDVHRGSGLFLKSLIGNKGFNKLARGTDVFVVVPRCTGCGECARVCHMDLITMVDGMPEWERTKCSQCLACVNVCPVVAIAYGGKKTTAERYWFERDAAKYL
ncbi:MAG: EFR1 family ferrodoxin [Anaerovoracaceae bacterium]|jgi:ferredoxin